MIPDDTREHSFAGLISPTSQIEPQPNHRDKTHTDKFAAACLLLAGTMILSQCGGGSVRNMNASSFSPHQLAMKSRAALNGHYKSNPASRKLNIKRFSPSSILARFR